MIRAALQEVMMEHCSVFRTQSGLEHAQARIRELKERYREIGITYGGRAFNLELIEALECENLLELSATMVASALHRQESRGAHYRDDFPARDDARFLTHTLIFREGDGTRIETTPVSITRFQPVARTY